MMLYIASIIIYIIIVILIILYVRNVLFANDVTYALAPTAFNRLAPAVAYHTKNSDEKRRRARDYRDDIRGIFDDHLYINASFLDVVGLVSFQIIKLDIFECIC